MNALCCLLLLAAPPERISATLDIAPVWAGHPVGFDLLTAGGQQFVAYYAADRRLTVAQRALGEPSWRFTVLPTRVGWDSHNYVTLTADDEGLLHLSGNMHVAPLLYFRGTKPYDAASLVRATPMVGERETRCTYPSFFRGPANELIFTYRDGQSGNGDQIFNVWEPATHTWRRLLDRALTNGEGHRNAYFVGPVSGPDGFWHLVWVWRESGDCASNHDLSYARSRDLRHWETSAGVPLELPITLKSGEVVDPVPQHGGIINGNTRLGFDSHKRPILSYHKYDAAGHIQIFNARREEQGWKLYQTTDWHDRWDFSGGGSIVFEVTVGGVVLGDDGRLRQSWRFSKVGSGTWLLDEATLKPLGLETRQPTALDGLGKPAGTTPGLLVHWLQRAGDAGVRYALRWETLGPNRDRARAGALPEPSALRLYVIRPQ